MFEESRHSEVQEKLKTAIIQGVMAAGFPIREVETAARLGISRTPLRETLFKLEREGFVQKIHGKGFQVTSLNERDATEIYPLIGSLERFALEHSGKMLAKKIRSLRNLNQKLGRSKTRAQRIDKDTQLHAGLTMACDNQRLQHTLQKLRDQAARYEWVYGEPETIQKSFHEHERILDELERGNQAKAAVLLERHSVECVPKLIEFIRARQASVNL